MNNNKTNMEFDHKTADLLQYYVYALIDPAAEVKTPFYIGKGVGNRVFNHAKGLEIGSDKMDLIHSILARNENNIVEHVIIRHGMDEKTSLEVESALIDTLRNMGINLTNIVTGHDSGERGLMLADEVIRKYNAQPLDQIDPSHEDKVVIININKTYKRSQGAARLYSVIKEAWPIGQEKVKTLKFVMAEYEGIILEVYEAQEWYGVDSKTSSGKARIRYGFNGKIAEDNIRMLYVNKSVAHFKKWGMASSFMYKNNNLKSK